MKRVGNLYEKIISFENLRLATKLASKGGKKFRAAVSDFLLNREKEILELQKELIEKSYCPAPYRQFTIHDPKKRTISVAKFRDRVVYHALCHIIGPILDKTLIFDSYACRNNKGTDRAIARAQYFARKECYFLKIDIRRFFESIDHKKLKLLLKRKFKDQDLLWLLDQIIDNVPASYSKGRGLPIGNLTSQHFANFFLSAFDHYVKEKLHISSYLRYMDDAVLFAQEKDTLWRALHECSVFLQDNDLQIKPKSIVLASVYQGVPFLGFRIYPSQIRLLRKTWRRFKQKYRLIRKKYLNNEISEDKLVQSITSLFSHIQNARSSRKKFIDLYPIDV